MRPSQTCSGTVGTALASHAASPKARTVLCCTATTNNCSETTGTLLAWLGGSTTTPPVVAPLAALGSTTTSPRYPPGRTKTGGCRTGHGRRRRRRLEAGGYPHYIHYSSSACLWISPILTTTERLGRGTCYNPIIATTDFVLNHSALSHLPQL